MNLTEIRKIASELKITGRSKMNKAELIIAIGDACYDEATTMDAATFGPMAEDNDDSRWYTMNDDGSFSEVTTLAEWMPVKTGRKSYTERMLNRVQGYYAQNGCAKLTAKQQRRVDKKYRKQYGNLLSSLV